MGVHGEPYSGSALASFTNPYRYPAESNLSAKQQTPQVDPQRAFQTGNPFKQSVEDNFPLPSLIQKPDITNSANRGQVSQTGNILPAALPLIGPGGFFMSKLNPSVPGVSETQQHARVEEQNRLPIFQTPQTPHMQVVPQKNGTEELEQSQITSPYPEHPRNRIGKPTSHNLGTHRCQEDCEDCNAELEIHDKLTVRPLTSSQQVAQAKEQMYAELMSQLQREDLPNNNQENLMRLYSGKGSIQEEDSTPANLMSGRLRSKGKDLLGDTSSRILKTMEKTLNDGLGIAEPAIVTSRGVKTVVTKTTTTDKFGNTLPHHIVKFVSETSGPKSNNLVYRIDEYQAKNYLGKPKVSPGGGGLASQRLGKPVSPRTTQTQTNKQTQNKPNLVKPEDFWPNPKKFAEKPVPRFELTELQRMSVEAESMRHSLSYVTPKYEPGNLNFNLETLQSTRRTQRSGSNRKQYDFIDDSSDLRTPQSKAHYSPRYSEDKDQMGPRRPKKSGLLLSEMTPEQIERKVADSLRDLKFD